MKEIIKEIIQNHHLTQKDFGKRIGYRQPMVAHLLNGKPVPPRAAFMIEQEFGVDCERFHPWMGDLKRLAIEKNKPNK